MKLLFYKIRLAFHLSVFILKLSANFSNKVKPFIISLFIFGLLTLIGGISLINNSQKTVETITITSVIPNNKHLFESQNLTTKELELKIIYWEEILKIQPQSRDILLNLSQLYSALELKEESLDYRNKALSIDPNNPLFE